MGKLTISMAIFNSYVSLPEGSPYRGPGNTNQNGGSIKSTSLARPLSTCVHFPVEVGIQVYPPKWTATAVLPSGNLTWQLKRDEKCPFVDALLMNIVIFKSYVESPKDTQLDESHPGVPGAHFGSPA